MRSVIAAVVAFLLTCLVLVAVPVIALGSQSPTGGICGPGGTGQSVANVTLDAEQLANAATIVTVTGGRALPPDAIERVQRFVAAGAVETLSVMLDNRDDDQTEPEAAA